MAKTATDTLDTLKQRREKLAAELAAIREQETELAEQTLREHSEKLLSEITRLGYGAWSFEGSNGLMVRVSRKRAASVGGNGHEVTVYLKGKEIGTFASAKKAAEHLRLETKNDSAVRVLKRRGYTLKKK